MEEIIVSVIIPAYNCARYISQALDSALMQDVPLEVIVINDCSQDNLDEIMAPYLQKPNIRYLKNETNLGVAKTRNRGVSEAKGDYVAFLDGDDVWELGKLEKQLSLMEKKNAVICSTARQLMTPEGGLTGCVIPVKTEYSFRDLCRGNLINCSSVLLERKAAREFPMHHDDSHEDYLMWLEVLKKYGHGCAVNEPLLKYRVSSTGKSGSKWHSAKMTYKTYRYMGFTPLQSALYFVSYAFHGVIKYLPWFLYRHGIRKNRNSQ